MPTSTSPGLEETWRLLRQHLSWLDSHWIGFLATPDPRIANTLGERADWQLRSRGRMLIRFQPRSSEELGAMLPEIEAAGEPTPIPDRQDPESTADSGPGRPREVVAADARSDEAMEVLGLIRESDRSLTAGDPAPPSNARDRPSR